jgi:hypothetical protein
MRYANKFFLLLICFIAFFNVNTSAQIPKGYYFIHCVSDNNYCIDLQKGVVQDGQNIQLYQSNGTDAQKWYFEPNNDGTYFIRSAKNQDYVLDAQKGIAADGTNLQLYHFNGTKAQKWHIEEGLSGYFFFRSAIDRNYVIDLSNGITQNGSNIQLYHHNGTKAQMWKLFNSRTGQLVSISNNNAGSNYSTRTAIFSDCWLEHNVVNDGKKMIKCHYSANIYGAAGHQVKLVMSIECPKGERHYGTKGRPVEYSKTFDNNYDNTAYRDKWIGIYNNSINPLPGKHTYYVRLTFYDLTTGEFLGESDCMSFTMTGGNG